ncbi:MAG: phenylalanine--tRNA ligase subunit beta [Deltaproteobacteria bacterium]|jgi:phenylalanyl-tRNA synthetase beta chain|nr:phenylalanine--tRNA ligase subunit beta [Deltaproteobacteria bacterium]
MLAPVSWLGEFVDINDLSPSAVAETLTMIGLEVEDLRDRLAFLKEVVVCEVISASDRGERLRSLEVNAGPHGKLTVLCADPLVRVGGFYPLALIGAELSSGPVKEKVIGGETSQGMLCSENELGLSADLSKVMALSGQPTIGQPLSALLDLSDYVMEISVTPNRADALSMFGLARDLATALNRPLIEPVRSYPPLGESSAFDQIGVDIECPEHCWRYTGRVINRVTISDSPAWMVRRLLGAGLRAINNLVDVTNYVMLEIGHPLHAFDLKKIAGQSITVRVYGQGQKFVTLDGQERTLKSENNIMICDAERAVGLGGVMGGLNTEVDESTVDVFLEAACFNPTTIRKTSKSLGLSTDASYRFERGLDPNGCHLAVDRAANLMAQISGGQVAKGRLDVYPKLIRPKVVTFSATRCNALLGASHAQEDIERVLKGIGVEITKEGPDSYQAALPTWRPDLSREVDLIEEVVRLLDFGNLPVTLPTPPAPATLPPSAFQLRDRVRDVFLAIGFSEHVSFSFISPEFAAVLNLPENHPWRLNMVKVQNPLSEEYAVLRPSLLPGLLSALRLNQYHGQRDVALFETGAIFLKSIPKPQELQTLAGLMSGFKGSGNWCDPKKGVDFWDIKGVVEVVGESLGLSMAFDRSKEALPPFYDCSQAANILVDGQLIGHLGLLGRGAAKNLGLKEAHGQVYVFEFDIANLPIESQKPFRPWSNYPGVTRDMAVVIDRKIAASEILGAIAGHPEWKLQDVSVFDLYEGDKIPSGKKSLALRLYFQDFNRTLTDELVNGYFNQIVDTLADQFNAELRC